MVAKEKSPYRTIDSPPLLCLWESRGHVGSNKLSFNAIDPPRNTAHVNVHMRNGQKFGDNRYRLVNVNGSQSRHIGTKHTPGSVVVAALWLDGDPGPAFENKEWQCIKKELGKAENAPWQSNKT